MKTSQYGDLGHVYTPMLPGKNIDISHCFGLLFTPIRSKDIGKMNTSECGDLSGDFEKGARENAGVNSERASLSKYDGHCHAILT